MIFKFIYCLKGELRKGKSNIYYENRRLSKRKRQLSSSSEKNIDNISEEETDDYYRENANEELKSGLKKDVIPMVLIVCQGGWTTLKIVEDAIKQNVPILVLAVSRLFSYLKFSRKHLPNYEYPKPLFFGTGQ